MKTPKQLIELMLHAEQFCSKVEEATKDVAPIAEYGELRVKIGQIRNQLTELQEIFNDGKLSIENPRVRAQTFVTWLWRCSGSLSMPVGRSISKYSECSFESSLALHTF